jgi:hypothetical protein
MSLTHFPEGITSFGAPVFAGEITSGNVYWVDSNATSGGTGEFANPYLSIETAFNRSGLKKGDRIICKEGHAESVTASAGIDMDVAGVMVIGLGSGTHRPTITFTTATTADIDIDAANITLVNVLFLGGVDALVGPLDVNSSDFKLLNCEYRDSTGQCVDFLLADANADRMLIDGFVYRGDSAAGTNSAIALTGCDDVEIKNFYFDGNFAVGVIDCRTTAVTNLRVREGFARTRNAADIFIVDTVTGSTGMIGPNINLRLQDNAANITEACTGATFVYFQPINIVNLAGESSMQTNITASTDA